MNNILIFDTGVASQNLGDLIIMDAVLKVLKEIFPGSRFLNTPTHITIEKQTFKLHRQSQFSFVAGTNLLSSNMPFYNQWKINMLDAIFLKNILLLGVGWWQYQAKPNIYTRLLLKSVLNKKIKHSVRDEYTKNKLDSIGIKNVINTGCPTTWNLTPNFCSGIPQEKAKSVIFTLTDYNKNIQLDHNLIDILQSTYENIFFWPQGTGDYEYLKSLKINNINIVAPTLQDFDAILSSDDSIEYVGTRLHAGIRALQHKRRSIILAVDNRATEKSKDANFPVVQRDNIEALRKKITSNWETSIKIPLKKINNWKSQFEEIV